LPKFLPARRATTFGKVKSIISYLIISFDYSHYYLKIIHLQEEEVFSIFAENYKITYKYDNYTK